MTSPLPSSSNKTNHILIDLFEIWIENGVHATIFANSLKHVSKSYARRVATQILKK